MFREEKKEKEWIFLSSHWQKVMLEVARIYVKLRGQTQVSFSHLRLKYANYLDTNFTSLLTPTKVPTRLCILQTFSYVQQTA